MEKDKELINNIAFVDDSRIRLTCDGTIPDASIGWNNSRNTKFCWKFPTILSMTDEDGVEHDWSLIDLLDGLTILAEKARKNPPKKGGKYEP